MRRSEYESSRILRLSLVTFAVAGLLGGCHSSKDAGDTAASESIPVGAVQPDAIRAAVADFNRPEEDRARDLDRKPVEVLRFFGVEPGMHVAELMAGTGYYTEILSKAVGRDGKVYCQNSPFVLDRFAEGPLSERLSRPGLENVSRIRSEPAAPELPPGLDAAILIRFYHDFYWQEVDRAAFNRAVFAALKPGGVFGVLDHHAAAGSKDRDVKSLHRVDAAMVRDEMLAAGFVLEAESSVLEDLTDSLDWNIFADDSARRDKTSRFVFRFRKP